MRVPEGLFKAYDVRGVYPKDLSDALARNIGKAFVTFVQKKLKSVPKVIVGYDMRISTPVLSQALIDGLVESGAKVWDIGLVSTDTVSFASGKYQACGIMLTASHNPPDWNGIKFCLPGAVPINENTGLQDIKKTVEQEKFVTQDGGGVEKKDVLLKYVQHVQSFINTQAIRPMKVAIDAGNGMAGKLTSLVFKELPLTIIPLYFELDGTFPNHQPSPIEPENVQDLIRKVRETKADFGMAFDGDADRIYFIDENGGGGSRSMIVAMIAESMLEKHRGASIIYNVSCSKIVQETIRTLGGQAIRERVGHTFIKERMQKTGAIFAGEHSGHFYYIDNFRADSAFITALIVLEILSQTGKKLSELVRKYQKYYAIEERSEEHTSE